MTLARLFVFIGGVVVLLLTAALVAPYFIDWANYRADFERQAGHVLGREVRVDGAARARLLPFPSVTFTDVVVAGSTPDAPAMTIEEFSMDAELAPFLRGELLIFDMRLVRPHAHIEVDETGRVDWAVRPSSPFDPRQVSLEKLSINDGRITISQAAGARTIVLNNIETEMSARSLAGPWRMEGSLDIDGLAMALSGSTGTAGPDGLRVRLALRPSELPFALDVDGQASLDEGAGLYAGTFDLRSNVVEEPLVDGEAAAPQTAVAGNRVTGRFALDHQRLTVEEFRLSAGSAENPYTADGNAEIAFGAEPFFSVVADGAQIRWDGDASEETGSSRITAAERLAAFTSFISGLPKPTIPGTVSVNLPAIVAGDTTIRDIGIRAEPVAEGWSIGSVAATLPGRTRFEGSGLLSVDDNVSFSGHMLLAIAQPSGFAMWVAQDVDDAIRRLSGAGFSADVTLNGSQQVFDNLELMLGDAAFTGRVERQSPADRRPSMTVTLDGGRLDLDGLRAFTALFVDEQGRNRLTDHDVDVDFAAGPVVSQGMEAERLETALRLREQVLEIDRFSATGLADANIGATGRIENLSTEPEGSIDATIVAVDLAPLVDLIATRFPDVRAVTALARNAASYPGLLEDAAVDLLASYSSDSTLRLNIEGEAGGTVFSASGSGRQGEADAPVEARITARNPEAANLYALVGLPALPLGLAGEANLEAELSGPLGLGAETKIKFTGEGLAASFDGTLSQSENRIGSRGRVELSAQDFEPWLSAAGVALPGFGYGLPAEIKATVDVSDKLAVISDLTGNIAGSDLYGDLNAEMRDGRPHLTGSLYVAALDLSLPLEMVTGSEALLPAGAIWPEASFQRAISTPFTADIELASERLWFGDWATAENTRMQLRLDAERLAFANATGEMFGGTIEGLAELRNDGGTGLLSAQFSLNSVPVDELLPETGLAGTADISATVGANGKSINALVASLSGSGSAALSDLVVPGLDPTALPELIAQADELGAEIDSARVGAFAPEIVRDGNFPAGSAELAFTLANGVARFPPLQLATDGARMSVEGSANFRQRSISASGSMTYEPGLDGVAGAEPMVRFAAEGPVADFNLSLDTEPLAQFLTQRALEREQERVEHMQSVLLETQRLRREVRYFEQQAANRAAEEAERVRLEREAERARKLAEEERQRQEAERRAAEERQRQEAERERAEQERRRQLEATPAPLPVPQTQPQAQPQQPMQMPAPQLRNPATILSPERRTAPGTLSEDENRRRLQQMFSR